MRRSMALSAPQNSAQTRSITGMSVLWQYVEITGPYYRPETPVSNTLPLRAITLTETPTLAPPGPGLAGWWRRGRILLWTTRQ